MPVSAVNCSLAIWLATIVGGVASEVKRIVVPLNGLLTSFSQAFMSSGVCAAASSLPTLVRPPNGRPWPRKVEAKPEKPMPASAMRRMNSRLPMRCCGERLGRVGDEGLAVEVPQAHGSSPPLL